MDVIEASPAVPFSEKELRLAMDNVNLRRSKGSDLQFGHPVYIFDTGEVVKSAQEGRIFMRSDTQLLSGFLFLKLNAGQTLFGKQKAVYASYIEPVLGVGEWTAGPVFKSWLTAITSIGNIYRANGYG